VEAPSDERLYEVKAGIGEIAGKTVRSALHILQRQRYMNTFTFTFLPFYTDAVTCTELYSTHCQYLIQTKSILQCSNQRFDQQVSNQAF